MNLLEIENKLLKEEIDKLKKQLENYTNSRRESATARPPDKKG